jgi:broad specificity phosphatase PhoE
MIPVMSCSSPAFIIYPFIFAEYRNLAAPSQEQSLNHLDLNAIKWHVHSLKMDVQQHPPRRLSLRLILVRHGETVWNKERRVQGISNIELSKAGLLQAERVAASLKNENITSIYTSPLKRAYQTAFRISAYHSAPITIVKELQEMNQGDFEGLSFKDLTEKHADFLKQWLTNPESCVMPNGESLAMLQARAWPVIERVLKNKRNSVVVAHNFTITTILCKFMNLSLSQFRQVHVDPGSKTVVEIQDNVTTVKTLNDVSHLRLD